MIQIESCINRLNSKRFQNFHFKIRIVILRKNHKNDSNPMYQFRLFSEKIRRIRRNPEYHPSNHFCDFVSKMTIKA